MKIVRINKGKSLGFPIRFVAAVVIVIAAIQMMRFLPEPWSILITIFFSLLLPMIWFSTKLIIINMEENTVFDGTWMMGFKFGKQSNFQAIEKLYTERASIKKTAFSLDKNQEIITDHEYRIFLKTDTGNTYYLLSHPLKDRIEEKLAKIRKKLDLN